MNINTVLRILTINFIKTIFDYCKVTWRQLGKLIQRAVTPAELKIAKFVNHTHEFEKIQ